MAALPLPVLLSPTWQLKLLAMLLLLLFLQPSSASDM
jgi:hypothetical protein